MSTTTDNEGGAPKSMLVDKGGGGSVEPKFWFTYRWSLIRSCPYSLPCWVDPPPFELWRPLHTAHTISATALLLDRPLHAIAKSRLYAHMHVTGLIQWYLTVAPGQFLTCGSRPRNALSTHLPPCQIIPYYPPIHTERNISRTYALPLTLINSNYSFRFYFSLLTCEGQGPTPLLCGSAEPLEPLTGRHWYRRQKFQDTFFAESNY